MRISKVVLTAVAVTFAGIFASSQPTRTMGSLVQAALQQGELGKIGKRDSKTFQIPADNPTKTLWFDQGALDEHEHVFQVILKDDGQPDAILIESSVATEDETGKRLKGWDFLVTPDGEIKKSTTFSGIVGKLVEKKLSAKAAKKAFEHEKAFWFEKSVDHEFSK